MEMWLPDIPYTACCLSLSLSHSLSVCIYFICCLFLSVFILSSLPPPPLLMLFQVFYLYSITTKNKYLSGDISCSMLCLLAVFIAYNCSLHHSPLPPFPPPDVFPCPDSLLSPPILDVFQAVPEKPQWDCRQTEQSSNPRSRLQHQGHGQWQLHVQVRPHAHWW